MTRIEGTAANLPASYMQAALGARQLGMAFDRQLRMQADAIAAQANGGGMVDQRSLQEFNALGHTLRRLDELLTANLQLAKVNPAVAERYLRTALGTPPAPGEPMATRSIREVVAALEQQPPYQWPNGSDVGVPA
jgi:hypothetical protein